MADLQVTTLNTTATTNQFVSHSNTLCLQLSVLKMSFKRDGNDTGLLKNLQHRRVIEILGDHIPDDEAKLLSNGRLTCTVCSRKPIFDTMQMLSLHRKGKKHLFELSQYLQYKRDMEFKKAKGTQKSFLKTEQITIKPDINSSLSAISYTTVQTKRKSFSNLPRRKFALDITESCERIKSSLNPPCAISLSANSQVRRYLKSLPRKRPLEKTVNRLRESYGGKTSQCKSKSETKLECKKADENISTGRDVDYKIKLLESGWIQDMNGKWMKDPNVEFDSDEEEPPAFP